MTQETAVTNNALEVQTRLQEWWTNANFNNKEYCDLKGDGTLVLKASAHQQERAISHLTLENAEHAIKALVEKYPEVEGRVNEVNAEWDAAEDKLKLLSKVSRLKDYLQHTNAIGNFEALIENVITKEKELQRLVNEHYEARLKLVQNAEELAKSSEDWKDTTQLFKEFSEQWKNAGYVDKSRNDELWNRLEAARQHFFDRKRIHHDEQEKEMLLNLDLKMELVEKAERLKDSEDWKATTEVYKQLMEEWKSIGRTMHDKNEELWNRFVMSKNLFFDRKKQHFELIQGEQQLNYDLKLALVEKAESLKDSEDWNKTSLEYAHIMDQWKATGRVPAEKADELWNRMSAAKDTFFGNKRAHNETVRVSLEDNYAQKLALVKRAESIKNSSQWRSTTEELNELMDEWKKIGPVPREHVNKIWEAFVSARRFFFDRKDADREKRNQQIAQYAERRAEQKKSFLHKLEEELKEEQEKLEDFKNALENITPGNKEQELRAHLTKLIQQCEQKISQKEKKIADVTKEFDTPETEETPTEEK
ncbi:MAG TPA: DUF349 domain-containing protein [Flavipsychrobacter sp.]|nr:DUF349 domain-containing protein [Flavipsychrobacter sp.]